MISPSSVNEIVILNRNGDHSDTTWKSSRSIYMDIFILKIFILGDFENQLLYKVLWNLRYSLEPLVMIINIDGPIIAQRSTR